MDELIILVGLALLVALLLGPGLAIAAWRRSGKAHAEILLLRERIKTLEQNHAVGTLPQSLNAEHTLASSPSSDEAQQNLASPALENPWAHTQTRQGQAGAQSADKKDRLLSGVISSLIRWFMQGNPLAKLGIILLFLGFSFLLRYTVERSLFPLELRLVTAALGAIALLTFGWRLRHKQPVYALILQGGATGVLYLTIFAAFRLWQMLPITLAFALLLLVCAASVALAILQRALSLAMLASLGGYLAPILLSTGVGSHIALFSFYLLLSGGILAISAWQHWRELNLLGMFFTFGVGSFWGIVDYQPRFYLSCQLFLIANIVLFGVLSVALSLRAQHKGTRIIDGVLLFAPPLVGFGMQYAMTEHFIWGPALSASGYGGFYLLLSWVVLKRYPQAGKPLVLAALALGGAFATLAIPLALSARWTSMSWALEGLGILWFGAQQQQRRMSYSGTGLLVLALLSAVYAYLESVTPLSLLMVFAILSASWLVAAWLWRGIQVYVSNALLAGGIACWIVALNGASLLVFHTQQAAGFSVLALSGLSVWLWRYCAIKLRWSAMRVAQWLLWPAILLGLSYQLVEQQHLFSADGQNLAWCVVFPSAAFLLWREGERLPARVSQGLHLSFFWLVLLALGMEYYWFIRSLNWGMEAWRAGLTMALGATVILLVQAAARGNLWPFKRWPAAYTLLGVLPLLPLLILLLLFANLQDGVVFQLRYIPLLNPLEEGAGFALVALFYYARNLFHYRPGWEKQRKYVLLVIGGLLFWWLNGLLLRPLAAYGDIAWQAESLWQSRLVQTSFALFWMLVALLTMLYATRHGARQIWLAGAVLLGVVMVKLMLVDSARGGGLARAIAFIGVAVLVLIVGYFSPLPPKAQRALNQGEEE
ncbi:DUF2339 domain-containing protein [Buttiauxella warmboldiae]|uniref:DUF2339 domain-containing protein n=1 Tax=Buttiauxella warmboldiae TaxID=82993 RepID=A0A3N5DHU9_9ENTR|nr:DUF2339 domain-containing protein [Buttiauxella warmboldiae]RPH28464.1 DUF2339 domain-containing protein [Buttiauxella warmboldiae]